MKSQHIFSSTACRTLPVRLSPANEKPAFADSRPSTQRQAQLVRNIIQYPAPATSQMKKVIQRASPDEWFDGIFRTPGPKTITVYSHILSDGYGDAGQLGNAVRELIFLRKKGIVQNVIPYATYDLPSSQYHSNPENQEKEEEERRANILSICPELAENKLQKTENNEIIKEKEKSGLAPFSWNPNNWELQFPVPAPLSPPIAPSRLLQIFEMGMSNKAVSRHQKIQEIQGGSEAPLYHTGVSPINEYRIRNEAVGYLIPSYREGNKYQGMLTLIHTLKLTNVTSIRQLYSYLKDAWFVKLNNPENALRVIKIATTPPNHCQKMILQGATPDLNFQAFGIPVYTIPDRVSQQCLDCLMACITEGRICAGGEGMFVQALGASTAEVSLIPQEGRDYGYQQGQYMKDSELGQSSINYFTYDTADHINSLILLSPNIEKVMKAQNANARRTNFFSRYMYSRFQSHPTTSMQSPTTSTAIPGTLPPLMPHIQPISHAAPKRSPHPPSPLQKGILEKQAPILLPRKRPQSSLISGVKALRTHRQ